MAHLPTRLCPGALGRRYFFVSAALLLAAAVGLLPAAAPAQTPSLDEALTGLGASDVEVVQRTVTALGDRGDASALRALEALYDDRLKVAADGKIYVVDPKSKALTHPLSGAPVTPEPTGLRDGEMNNTIRRVILPVIARLKIGAPDPKLRLEAAEELSRRSDDGAVGLLRKALAGEQDDGVKQALSLALAQIDIRSPQADARLHAVQILGEYGKGANKSELEPLTRPRPDGSFAEPDERVRRAAISALSAIENRERLVSGIGHLMYGVSLASVFLFAALGLAITFGVMGVINMAHGEMLTIGAYTTYAVQTLFAKSLPGLYPIYLLVAIPAAFVTAGATGVLLERTVIRWLYGRPLETLLATWGISLGLIQTIRLIFGASNVAVENPKWLAGGFEPLAGLVVSYNRLGVVVFVIAAAALVWFIVQRTPLGLQMRAVVQNRPMAACMGVRTARVDMWTFGLGSAIAGLGGVALSQIGNVGPELGQSYILDSFMVVVLGGVGRIAGTVAAALGLGIVQKFMEPVSGAVLGKIAVLVVIILFIQRRPQGMFAPKGRVEA
jgi:urea transport system permease protein